MCGRGLSGGERRTKRAGEGDVGTSEAGMGNKSERKRKWKAEMKAAGGRLRILQVVVPARGGRLHAGLGAQTGTHTGPEADAGVRLDPSERDHLQLRMSDSRRATPRWFCF